MNEEPLIALLADVWESIATVCAPLAEADYDLPTDCPGWTVRDQLAHVAGTESMLLGRSPEATATDTSALAHVRNDIGAMNEQWVEAFRQRSGAETLAAFVEVTAERFTVLRAMSADDWDREGFTPEGPGPYRQFMAIRVFDSWFHEQDIREAVGVAGGLDGPVADFALSRVPRALPFGVGKRAGAPQGATVVFEVAGATPIEIAVGVDGRAAVLDSIPHEPTVRIRTDRRTFARLAGGRRSGLDALGRGEVTIEGDRALGEAVVANLGYTI